ncbi:DUF87 domain-containing protein [Streptococcus uberis]
MGIKNIIRKTGQKSANAVAKLSVLSPDEIEKVESKREEYFSKLPDPNDSQAIDLTNRILASNSIEVYNAYLNQLKDYYLPLDNTIEYNGKKFDSDHNIRFINITKWVVDKNEDSLEKLINVYSVLSKEEVNVSLVFQRTKLTTNVFLAVTNHQNAGNNIEVEKIYKARLTDALNGNFPGSEWNDENGIGQPQFLKSLEHNSVAIASNIPTLKSEKFISQTIEKLIDGFTPLSKKEEYTLILMATPIKDVEERKLRLSEIYSSLAPYSSWQTNFTFNNSDSFGSSATVGVNVGASAGLQNTANVARTNSSSTGENRSTSQGQTDTEGQTHTEGESISDSVTKGKTKSVGVDVGGDIGAIRISANGSLSFSETKTHSISKNSSDAISRNVSNSINKTIGKAITASRAITQGVSEGVSYGANFGANFARSSTVTANIGYGEGITQNFTNYNIKHSLEMLEEQMKRYEQSSALGLWDFSAYVLSEDYNVANNIAHQYIALTLGEKSNMSKSTINLWRGDIDFESKQAEEICNYLKDLRHPIFGLNPEMLEVDQSFSAYPSITTATTPLSGKELSLSLNFPRKSIIGLPVIQTVEFGRNIATFDGESEITPLNLGKIFHMHHVENTPVVLAKESLSSHVFVTGSTGSGKSNTIYQLLDEVKKQNVKFLVIEPAKGEYKQIFGNRDDVGIFGTNPLVSNLLKINPFSFKEEVHILEHMDRLIEVFNVAWPMYAAMPAVLKNAIEKSYLACGWDLLTSTNKLNIRLFPSFVDVVENIKLIIDSSDYDNENKGAYKGSLVTRIESLTNGINGLIFTNDEIDEESLFNQNVIIDLSRVGSSETKSLIMGLLVLKLQEFRMASATQMNSELKHITILEEAHHLLKRTSFEQSSESSNLVGKSVEMLANAIAEMRTYGEGFVIADQSPSLLDLSVIRNTNTKIIMRLPDLSDRELVGRSANLNNDQITELAKLPRGVAAVYQNEWIQPVLCKINKFEKVVITPKNNENEKLIIRQSDNDLKENLKDWVKYRIQNITFDDSTEKDLKERVVHSNLNATLKLNFLSLVESSTQSNEALPLLLFELFNATEAIEKASVHNNISDFMHELKEQLELSNDNYSQAQIDLILLHIILELNNRSNQYVDLSAKVLELYNQNRRIW